MADIAAGRPARLPADLLRQHPECLERVRSWRAMISSVPAIQEAGLHDLASVHRSARVGWTEFFRRHRIPRLFGCDRREHEVTSGSSVGR
ncbi:protein of unknown function [Methylorubrum extorquens]|uniref:Uncharacterized protein n=1 Tax=Methylorubrum extorquens TaxID=408 RepID=A0A2N9AVP0_METEX|nr:protein of unknown function [Methylorubrum extorquens]